MQETAVAILGVIACFGINENILNSSSLKYYEVIAFLNSWMKIHIFNKFKFLLQVKKNFLTDIL